MRAQVVQQWLLPIADTALNGAPGELIVDGDTVQVSHRPTVFSLSTGLAIATPSGGPARPPSTVDLPDGRIAAVHEGRLILAEPFGGAAARDRPESAL